MICHRSWIVCWGVLRLAPKVKSGVEMAGLVLSSAVMLFSNRWNSTRASFSMLSPNTARVLRDRGVDVVGVQRAGRAERVTTDEVVVALLVLQRVAHDHRVAGAQLEVGLRGEQVVAERLLLRPLLVGQDVVGEHGREVVAPVPLVGREEMGRVPADWTANRPAELLLREGLLLQALFLLEERLCVQVLVAREDERAAAELVRPALRDHVHHAAHRPAELGAVALRGDLVLLDGVVAELLQQAADDAVVVVAAVHVDHHRAARQAAVADPARPRSWWGRSSWSCACRAPGATGPGTSGRSAACCPRARS